MCSRVNDVVLKVKTTKTVDNSFCAIFEVIVFDMLVLELIM